MDDGSAMTHQVVVKEIKRVDTQEKARIYTCVKCNINVTNIDELQYRACKECKCYSPTVLLNIRYLRYWHISLILQWGLQEGRGEALKKKKTIEID